jgi:hypothetical protein
MCFELSVAWVPQVAGCYSFAIGPGLKVLFRIQKSTFTIKFG